MSRARGISVDLVAEEGEYQFPVSLQRSSSVRVELTLWTWVHGQRFVRKRENLEGMEVWMIPGYRCDFTFSFKMETFCGIILRNWLWIFHGLIMACGGHVYKIVFYLGDWNWHVAGQTQIMPFTWALWLNAPGIQFIFTVYYTQHTYIHYLIFTYV